MTEAQEPAPLPPLPARVELEALRGLGDEELGRVLGELSGAERATRAAMAPYERQLAELRARSGEVATEQRRRERSKHVAARAAVREQAGSGAMPSIADVLAAPTSPIGEQRTLAEVRAHLRSGGEVGFGFATKPGVMSFTDGRRTVAASTVGEARRLYADGLEPGTPGLPGVRIHLAGTRIERLLPPDDVVVVADITTVADPSPI